MKYFLDTNIISYILKKNVDITQKLKNLIIQEDVEICISSVTYYELKRGLIATSAFSKMKSLNEILKKFQIVQLNLSTYDIAAENWANLKNKGLLIEDDDIFIGSNALENNAILVTNNPGHLSRILNLKIEVWTVKEQ